MKLFFPPRYSGYSFHFKKRSGHTALCNIFISVVMVWSAGTFADESFWTELSSSSARSAAVYRDVPLPSSYRAFTVDLVGLNAALDTMGQARSSAMAISLPHPEGGFEAFEISASGVMAPELAAQFPEIRAFRGRSIQDSRSTLQLEVTPRGVTAQVLAPGARWMIDPLEQGRADAAISYMARHTHTDGRGWKCDLDHEHGKVVTEAREDIKPRFAPQASRSIGQSLRTYRLAVSAAGEYSEYHLNRTGGTTKADVQAAITTTINRVAGIYEKELAISFQLIGANADIIFLSPATDPYTNPADIVAPAKYSSTLLAEAQKEITDIIGSANFDIGHVVSTGSGGVAGLGVVCRDTGDSAKGAEKARGMTGRSNPLGDAFDVDYVAHEIGHQFSGNHTYNGTKGNCSTGNPSTAYEPGSGSTIQAYAGICGADNLQANSDPIFSAASFDEMIAYVEDGSGASCASSSPITNTSTSATNSVPTVNAGSDYTVPNNTPLILTGSATDADGDSLTYLWEQRDLGPSVALGTADNGSSPLFRVWTPSSSPVRYLPKLATVVAGTQDNAEIVPSLERQMDFRLTARDNQGGVNSDDVVVNITETNALYPPFSVSEPSAGSESLGSTATVRWNVAETNVAPISTDTVDLYLSTDSGASFSSTPFASKPNNGYARVTFPSGIQTSTARLMIRGQNNIFYDVSNADFTLDSDAAATPETPTPVPWSLVPTNGGAEVYFGEGAATGGAAGIYQSDCRGERLDAYAETATPGEDISASQLEVTNSINIGASGSVPNAGLSLDLNITHEYRGDLKITLTSPAGTVVTVKDKDLDDSADDVILSDYTVGGFSGETLQGNWTLTVTDTYPSADDGTWVSWGLSGNGRSTQSASGSRDRSPIYLSSINNGWDYECDLTAYDNSVTPVRGSRTVSAGTVTPTASPTTYDVTPSASGGGSVSPDISLPVASGNAMGVELVADSGYQIASVGGTCGGTLSGSTYTTSVITGNCTVVASFSPLAPGIPNIDRTDYGDGEIILYVSAGAGGTPASYTASCTDGATTITGTGTSSPITVSGLTNGTAYTCTVTATNAFDTSAASSATASITPEVTTGLPIWLLYQATQ